MTQTRTTRRDPRHDPLFAPIRIGPKQLKNRFMQVPQCTGAGWQRPGADAAHREVKAEGGWAAICTEACMIHPETDQPVATVQTLMDEGDVINLRAMVDRVHRWDALVGVELCHAGGLSNNLNSRWVSPAMVAFPTPWMPQTYTYEAEEEDLGRIVGAFAEAARRAVDAGFDILYVHGTHGALPVQALSRHFNRRRDRYGGDALEDRARLWLEILEAIRMAAGDQVALASRISIDQLSGPAGVQLHDEGLAFVELVTRHGLLDLWDVNISSLEEWGEDAGPSRFYKTNHQAPWTGEVKRVAGATPVVGVGRFTDPDEMVRVLRSGQLDIIGCARPSIADPWLPRKVDEGRADEICECIGCNACISRFEYGVTIICTQNPTALEEHRRGWHPERFAPAPASMAEEVVLVVGAGPAGLECTRVLGRRGFQVHLVEAEVELGGHLRHVATLPGLAEWGRVIAYREQAIAAMPNVTLMRGTGRVEAADLLQYGAARIVLATGARWTGDGFSAAGREAISGIDAAASPRFVTPEAVWAGARLGRRVVILDGDGYFMAVSLAEQLAIAGHEVTVVTFFDRLAPMTDLTLEGPNLRRMAEERGIAVRTAQWVERAEEDSTGVRLWTYSIHRDGWRRTGPVLGELPRRAGTAVDPLDCDTVLLCTARRAEDTLWRELKARRAEWPDHGLHGVYRSGDCLAPRMLADAVFDGHRIGREIDSPDPQTPLSILRERPIVGQETYSRRGEAVPPSGR